MAEQEGFDVENLEWCRFTEAIDHCNEEKFCWAKGKWNDEEVEGECKELQEQFFADQGWSANDSDWSFDDPNEECFDEEEEGDCKELAE